MQHFALTLTPEGQVTLPAEARDALGIAPGEKLSLVVNDDGRATLAKQDPLHDLRSIAHRARARARPSITPSDDPIGDYLLVEDARTKS
ncbi:AbrB/MazE/SpoVT family DNA-binding domain-containing protein [Methylobacterium indicum]|uniref:AbrB/MazE/SpoVT family DNA-binding domain-containing protein n=1 Tax=Methylobacterium indicum TaxID=1775910 RepID=UPI002435B266|nr:AbrB/MazE/SpoVT family DNA-binding domain-containing protein [Methylobacterium indicum]